MAQTSSKEGAKPLSDTILPKTAPCACTVEKWGMRDDAYPTGKRWVFVLAGALHGGTEGSGAFPRGGAIPWKGAFGMGGGSWFVRGAAGQDGCR
jgi:hypothetical protein